MSVLPVGFGSSGIPPINNSLRFRASASAYASRTFGTPTSATTWTWSGWVKRGALSTYHCLFSGGASSSGIFFESADNVIGIDGHYSGTRHYRASASLYRDPSAWYHIVVVIDTMQAMAADRIKLFVNGASVSLPTAYVGTYPTQNSTSIINSAVAHNIGRRSSVPDAYLDGYLSRICFVDGTALTPSSFGCTDATTGQWVSKSAGACKAVVDAGGTNSFMLDFNDGTSLTTLGNDYSAKNNDWTLTNHSITAGVDYDWMWDTPTNNYAVISPLDKYIVNPSRGNLTSSGTPSGGHGSIGFASGKWYWEWSNPTIGSLRPVAGIRSFGDVQYVTYNSNGEKNINGTVSAYGASYTTTDVISVAVDYDGGSVTFYKNGVSQGAISYSFGGLIYRAFWGTFSTQGSDVMHANFGQYPFQASAAYYSSAGGFFRYAPPTGFKALCTANLTSDTVTVSGNFTGNANADGPFVWCNGTPETLTINGNGVTFGTHADRLANGFKLRTSSASYNASSSNSWTATILSPPHKSSFRNQRAKANP